MSTRFTRMFSVPSAGGDDDDGNSSEPSPWVPGMGPPEDELGVVVPLALVIGRSENSVVALRNATVYSGGTTFDFVALARGLRSVQSSRLLHDQHMFDAGEDPSDGFLRIGLELPGGHRVSNLGHRRGHGRFSSLGERPDAGVFFEHGGGGGSGGHGRLSLRPAFWLWPLPDSGTIQVFCEWPVVDLPLASVELDVRSLAEAAKRVVPLWPA